ncbi:beta-lactamase [Candidatus Nanosynbacter lyticus]|uniref:Beta-lactamase n=1 Tax=Candidatus Nanosynbacter lyticus TaxID=2093824 RepID=A0A6S4GRZ5_9BACT|nr:ribonuclease J [Candidatus Nanosynbacter lyticus]AJA06294.1 beta-lactamase [Candidatus Nanosynbacter lyticus]QCT41240.1 ribonuclease J [TM7 phylum sp. oral taxon 952]
MGQRRLATPQKDDAKKRPQSKKSNNAVLNSTTTRKGEVFRAQRRTSENVNLRASQHLIDIPVNKSVYNGYGGEQFSMKMQPKPQRGGQPKLRIIPIGGVGEMGIGKNMNAIEYDDEIIIVDMGFLFPGSDYPGINYITPDITWLEENKHKIKAHVFTHGHLDHIGSFRHFIHRIPAPVYGSKFTIGMLDKSMADADTDFQPDFRVMDPLSHEIVQVSKHFSVELVRVNHSIPDSTAVIIRTPLGVVIDSGDWRFEESPVDGQKFDLERMTEVASKEGVLMFMNESTNCESAGTHTHTEFDIQYSIGQVMDKFSNSRVILSCFSSQVHRLQLILEEAHKHGRKVAFAGFSMIQNLEVALRSGTIKIPKDTVMKMEDIIKLPDSQVTVVCTGSQGEFNAVLSRMATGAHKYMKIKGSDVVVFSSNPIPGNEKNVVRTVDGLMREGSSVIQNGKTHLTGIGPLHLSGHGYYDDHVKLINALNPTYYMPIHGEFHMLVYNARLAEEECGIPRKNIFVCDAGDIIEIDVERQAKKAGRIQAGGVMYDDTGAIVSEVVLKDRIHMSQEGMFVVVLTVQRGTGRLLTSPDIISRGFIYLRDSEELMNMIRQYLKQKAARSFSGKYDLDVIKKEIKDEVTHILYDQTRRTPIVIPVINEVGSLKTVKSTTASASPTAKSTPRNKKSITSVEEPRMTLPTTPRRRFPQRQVPDTEANDTKARERQDFRPY